MQFVERTVIISADIGSENRGILAIVSVFMLYDLCRIARCVGILPQRTSPT